MIKVYYRVSCSSSKKLLEWLNRYNISVQMLRIAYITRDDIIALLTLSEKGIDEIIKKGKRRTPKIDEKLRALESLSFNESIEYLLLNKNLIKTPIVMDRRKYMIGFHLDDVRQFLPREYRRRS